MRAKASVLIATAILGASALPGCNRRQPLPRKPDAGPAVEMVEARPIGLPSTVGSAPPALPLIEEHEPNDDPEHAQLITAGQGIRGSLAAPTSQGAGKGGDDFFVLHTEATRQQLRIEALGAADLQLELLDGAGQRLATQDERGRGEGELIQNLVLAPNQTFFVRVRGNVGAAGAEASGYTLTVAATAAPPSTEQEPNDTPLLASSAIGVDLSGALSFRRDEDYWVVSLPEAMGRRGGGGSMEGLRAPAVLRVELLTPGVVPGLRVLVQAAPPPRPAGAEDGGATEPTGPAGVDGGAIAPPLLTPLAEVGAGKGVSELRLRNLTLPTGSARAYLAVRGLSFSRPAGEARYHLRLTVETELEDAELEPNDDCTQATPLKLAGLGGGRSEGALAGFLWPGDIDCFRLQAPSTGPTRWQVKLALPGGDCQAALEYVRGGEGPAKATPDGTGGLELRSRGDVLVRVSSRERKTCFDAPYRLTASTEPDAPAARP